MSQGAANRREGFSPFNKIYEFGYMVQVNFPLLKLTALLIGNITLAVVQGQQANMVMTSLSGHLLNMEFAPQYKKWCVFFSFCISFLNEICRYSCNPIALFDAPMTKGLGEGNSSALIKKTLLREVTLSFFGFHQYDLF